MRSSGFPSYGKQTSFCRYPHLFYVTGFYVSIFRHFFSLVNCKVKPERKSMIYYFFQKREFYRSGSSESDIDGGELKSRPPQSLYRPLTDGRPSLPTWEESSISRQCPSVCTRLLAKLRSFDGYYTIVQGYYCSVNGLLPG